MRMRCDKIKIVLPKSQRKLTVFRDNGRFLTSTQFLADACCTKNSKTISNRLHHKSIKPAARKDDRALVEAKRYGWVSERTQVFFGWDAIEDCLKYYLKEEDTRAIFNEIFRAKPCNDDDDDFFEESDIYEYYKNGKRKGLVICNDKRGDIAYCSARSTTFECKVENLRPWKRTRTLEPDTNLQNGDLFIEQVDQLAKVATWKDDRIVIEMKSLAF